MGWETGVSLAASGVSGFSAIENAKSETKAIAQSAENTASNEANQTSRQIGSLESSFLRGGIALTGSGGPAAFFQQAATQGTIDISRTISNANASISNTMNQARTQALTGIAQGFAKIGPSALSSMTTINPDPSPVAPLIDTTQLDNFSTGSVGGGTANYGGANGTGLGSGINWGTS